MSAVVDLRDVSLSLGGRSVLDGVSFSIQAGDYLAILGPNGGGKTSLLKVILGLLRPDAGSVEVFGKSPRSVRGRVGYVPQRFVFDLDFPVRVRDVALMGRLAARPPLRAFRALDRDVAMKALVRMEVDDLADRPVGRLSGGQLQRVLIARALAVEPELLLLDEPTASLDERIGSSVWDLLAELSSEMTVVVVTHDIGAISQHVRHVACLNVKLHAHAEELSSEILEKTYGCPVDLLAHGQPHRVLHDHGPGGE